MTAAAAPRLDSLQAYVARALPDRTNATVRDLVSISAGWEAVELMRKQFGAFRHVYELFVARTGLHLRDVERLLAE